MNRYPLAIPTLMGIALATTPAVYGAEDQKPVGNGSTSMPPAAASHGGHRGGQRLILSNAEGAAITLWKPDLATQPLELSHGAIALPRTGMDNYHAIIAEKDWGKEKEAVIRYEYLRGKPSGHTPRELTSARKTAFELVPDPIPREHLRYYAGQTWAFITRLEDTPVGNVPVRLETANGSVVEAVSDAKGRVRIKLPDDFKDVEPGRSDPRSAGFMATATYEHEGTRYQTSLSADYSVSPRHWQNRGFGFAVIALGMVAGGLMTRPGRRKGVKA